MIYGKQDFGNLNPEGEEMGALKDYWNKIV